MAKLILISFHRTLSLAPVAHKNGDRACYLFTMGGLTWLFCVSDSSIPEEMRNTYIKKNGRFYLSAFPADNFLIEFSEKAVKIIFYLDRRIKGERVIFFDEKRNMRPWIAGQPDLTLSEIQQRCLEQLRVPIGLTALWHRLEYLGL